MNGAKADSNLVKGENMRTFCVVVLLMGVLAFPLRAQDNPKLEVFGGYQYLHIGGGNTNGPTNGEGFNGWNASLTGNITHHFGIEGNFGGAYDTIQGIDFKVYTYTGGPVVYTESGRIKPFAHVLFGGMHLSGSVSSGGGSASVSWNGYTIMAGGGVDVKANRAIAICLAEVDWLYYNLSSTSISGVPVPGFSGSNNVKISSGVVFRF